VGPNGKIGGVSIGDLLLALFSLGFLAKRWFIVPLTHPAVIVFAIPSLIVSTSYLIKWMTGSPLGGEDTSNLLKMWSLSVIAIVSVTYVNESGQVGAGQFLDYLLFVLFVGVASAVLVGLLQAAFPNIYNTVARPLYEMQLRDLTSTIERQEQSGRIGSIFRSPNTFAFFLAMSLTVLLSQRRAFASYLIATLSAIAMFALLLTGSRAALLTLLGCALLVLLAKRQFVLLSVLTLFGALVLLVLPVDMVLSERVLSRFEEVRLFVSQGRLPATLATRLEDASFLLGILSTSHYLLFGFPYQAYVVQVYISTDNQYLGWLFKYGLLGLLFVFWLMWLLFRSWRLRARLPALSRNRSALGALMLICMMILVGGLTQDVFYIDRWREFFFAFFPAVMAATRLELRGQSL
jgi:hypothetical protein